MGRAQWKLECRKSSNPPAGNVPPDSIISAPEKWGETSVGPFFTVGKKRGTLPFQVIDSRHWGAILGFVERFFLTFSNEKYVRYVLLLHKEEIFLSIS